MAHLILTTNDIGAYNLRRAGVANAVIGFRLRFVSGPLPSETDLAALIEARSAKHDALGKHWLDYVRRSWVDRSGGTNLGLIDLCSAFDSIELWADPRPNDQLVLVWLLDLLRSYREIVSKLSLVQTDDDIGGYLPESLSEWKLPAFRITDDHLSLASRAWNAYRAATPERCFDLLLKDLTIFPRLRPALIAMLEELPDQWTGLGASEMAMLDWAKDGCTEPRSVLGAARHRKVFDEDEAGVLLDDLAQCPEPVIFGLGDAPFDMGDEARSIRYRKGRVALTELGHAVAEAEDDIWRHNPIRRWWGGTLLTNDRLWRWNPQTRALVAP